MKKLLEELFSNYYRDIYTYLYSLCRDASLSEELTSDVFLEVVKSIATFRGDADVKTWLFSIARHQWYRHLRRKKKEPDIELLTNLLCVSGSSPENRCLVRMVLQRFYELLDQEPERTRQIVLMRLEGYSFHEVGLRCGISESSARVIDFRAKAKLRKILEKEGYLHE